MRKYSLDNGRIIEFESEDEKNDELSVIYREIMARDKNRKKPPFDESLVAIDFVCSNECTSAELINDTTEDELAKVRQAVRDYVENKEGAHMPYIIYRKSMRERICCECTRIDDKVFWRVLRADSITSRDIKYLVDTMKAAGIYNL